MKRKLEFEIGDIIYIAGTNIEYEITKADGENFQIKSTDKEGKFLFMKIQDLEDAFETKRQQRRRKLEKLSGGE